MKLKEVYNLLYDKESLEIEKKWYKIYFKFNL